MRQSSSILQHSTLARGSSPPKANEKKSNGEVRTNGVEAQGHAKPEIEQTAEDVPMADINEMSEKPATQEEMAAEMAYEQAPPAGSQDIAVASDGDSLPMSRTRSNGVRPMEPARHAPPKSVSSHGGDEEGKHGRSGSNNHILKQIASFNRSPVMGRRELPGTEDESSASDSRPTSRAKRPGRTSRRQESRARSPAKGRDAAGTAAGERH